MTAVNGRPAVAWPAIKCRVGNPDEALKKRDLRRMLARVLVACIGRSSLREGLRRVLIEPFRAFGEVYEVAFIAVSDSCLLDGCWLQWVERRGQPSCDGYGWDHEPRYFDSGGGRFDRKQRNRRKFRGRRL
jgi:hypothetical protein